MEMQDAAYCKWAELFYIFKLAIILYCKNFVSYIQQQGSQDCFVLALVFIHIWIKCAEPRSKTFTIWYN